MARNPVTELIYGPRELDAAGIGPDDTFRVLTPLEAMRRGTILEKCRRRG